MDGPAGVGKSSVAQTWADEMEGLLSATFFFFCANGWNEAIKLFPTIAYQLAIKYGSYRAALDSAITRDPLILDKSLSVQFQVLIVQPILESSPEDQNAMADTVIVIDGFDECAALNETLDSSQTQVQIIDIITTSALNDTSPFLWGVFSRPEMHILAALQATPAVDVTWRLTLPLKALKADEDIKAYLENAFETIRWKYPSIPPSWPSEESLTQLVAQADGLFIYSTSVTRFIEQNNEGSRLGPKEWLQLLLEPEQGMHAKLSKVDQLYILIMDQIPEHTLPNTLLILYAYHYLRTQRPIWSTVPILSSLLGFSQPTFDDAISPLRAILQEYSNGDHKLLRFYHTSFTDFLADSARCQARYYIRTNKIWAQFFSACVDILCLPLPSVSGRHCKHLPRPNTLSHLT